MSTRLARSTIQTVRRPVKGKGKTGEGKAGRDEGLLTFPAGTYGAIVKEAYFAGRHLAQRTLARPLRLVPYVHAIGLFHLEIKIIELLPFSLFLDFEEKAVFNWTGSKEVGLKQKRNTVKTKGIFVQREWFMEEAGKKNCTNCMQARKGILVRRNI